MHALFTDVNNRVYEYDIRNSKQDIKYLTLEWKTFRQNYNTICDAIFEEKVCIVSPKTEGFKELTLELELFENYLEDLELISFPFR